MPHTPTPLDGTFLTSADEDRPAALVVVPGTPVVDTRDEVFGRAVAMTPSFCLIRPVGPREKGSEGGGGVYVVAWPDVAVVRVALPKSVTRGDQWDSYALILQHIDHAQAFGRLSVFDAARWELLGDWFRPEFHRLFAFLGVLAPWRLGVNCLLPCFRPLPCPLSLHAP